MSPCNITARALSRDAGCIPVPPAPGDRRKREAPGHTEDAEQSRTSHLARVSAIPPPISLPLPSLRGEGRG
jgi:hypothetical protein